MVKIKILMISAKVATPGLFKVACRVHIRKKTLCQNSDKFG